MQTSEGNYKIALRKVMGYFETEINAERSIQGNTYSYTGKSTELTTETKVRINQNVLRKYVLNYYNNQCSLCDIDKPDLLICSHIKPWAIDPVNRLNPSNAISFCVLHDRLFDKGYFGLSPNYEIVFGQRADQLIRELVGNHRFKIPNEHAPDPEFLQYHLIEVCK